jgi:hypothetical protein
MYKASYCYLPTQSAQTFIYTAELQYDVDLSDYCMAGVWLSLKFNNMPVVDNTTWSYDAATKFLTFSFNPASYGPLIPLNKL